MSTYKFTVVVERDEDGLYVASVPALQGCYTQGETYEEAVANIKDAIRLHIGVRRDAGEPISAEEQYMLGYLENPETPEELEWICKAGLDALAEEPWDEHVEDEAN